MDSLTELYKEMENNPEVELEMPLRRNRIQKRQVKLSREPRTYKEEQLEEFYRIINWDNKTFVRDSRRFFALSNAVLKKRGESILISTLRYCKEKSKLYPNYICGALVNKLNGK